MVTADAFRNALTEILIQSQEQGLSNIEVRSGNLHKELGGYPGPNARMPVCCSVMRSIMDSEDTIITSPLKGNGANLVIRYHLPRDKIIVKKKIQGQKSQQSSPRHWFETKLHDLSSRYSDLSELNNLDKLMSVDPQSAVIKIRRVAEKLSHRICKKHNIPFENSSFNEICNRISDNQILSKKSINYLHSIRKMGNVFAHPSDRLNEKLSEQDIVILAQALCAIVEECLDENLI